jgi:hypothetical protein
LRSTEKENDHAEVKINKYFGSRQWRKEAWAVELSI